MRSNRNWVLTLVIVATTPGIVLAGPLSFLKTNIAQVTGMTNTKAAMNQKQQVAEAVAAELRKAKISGFDIGIEYRNGIAKLNGMIADEKQKAQVTEIVLKVNGVDEVDNKLTVMNAVAVSQPKPAVAVSQPKPAVAVSQPKPKDAPATLNTQILATPISLGITERPTETLQEELDFDDEELSARDYDELTSEEVQKASQNQMTAQQIAGALSGAGLNGYDIEIQYQNGMASLLGSVATPEQRMWVTKVASQVPGVQAVDNRLALSGNPYSSTKTLVQPQGSPVASHAVYNTPNLPEHAWPSYASYPNYSQLSYPKEYSASAWPYIGPFYPYPQIPLGWRSVQLEWDDGYWGLNFRPRTQKWFWFMNPKNW